MRVFVCNELEATCWVVALASLNVDARAALASVFEALLLRTDKRVNDYVVAAQKLVSE
jgi:hypothetical protein